MVRGALVAEVAGEACAACAGVAWGVGGLGEAGRAVDDVAPTSFLTSLCSLKPSTRVCMGDTAGELCRAAGARKGDRKRAGLAEAASLVGGCNRRLLADALDSMPADRWRAPRLTDQGLSSPDFEPQLDSRTRWEHAKFALGGGAAARSVEGIVVCPGHTKPEVLSTRCGLGCGDLDGAKVMLLAAFGEREVPDVCRLAT